MAAIIGFSYLLPIDLPLLKVILSACDHRFWLPLKQPVTHEQEAKNMTTVDRAFLSSLIPGQGGNSYTHA
ncbi:hypothetical protein SPV1_05854 [Mariprofundus ferrooxydans PV-1]|uniref:Uncharacterized protein n=1 Tax=Mariprofundus ferrooxydans PV-1 TaxID=314345 RepID=Q0EYD1_9PROT|nr:hypothetical protein SPV1_05854 [Mariprofundus ferrooxydans PV-1]